MGYFLTSMLLKILKTAMITQAKQVALSGLMRHISSTGGFRTLSGWATGMVRFMIESILITSFGLRIMLKIYWTCGVITQLYLPCSQSMSLGNTVIALYLKISTELLGK